jgi:hypothetical protein
VEDKFVCRNINWSSFPTMLCIFCGDVNTWIGVTQLLEGPPASGILLMWDRRIVEKIKECVREFIVACFFKNVEDGFS